MANDERERWNAKYRDREYGGTKPSPALIGLQDWVPTTGQALDVAGGAGANALWLAQRGVDVTVVDISEVGLAHAQRRARQAGVSIQTVAMDLEAAQLPTGPWSLMVCVLYLQRNLIPAMASALIPGGRLIWVHPTQLNLQRHARPGPRFLLKPQEAARLVHDAGLMVRLAEESWIEGPDQTMHWAQVVAERPSDVYSTAQETPSSVSKRHA